MLRRAPEFLTPFYEVATPPTPPAADMPRDTITHTTMPAAYYFAAQHARTITTLALLMAMHAPHC